MTSLKKLLAAASALLIGTLGLTGCTGEVEQTNKSLTVAYYGTDFGAATDTLNKAAFLFREAYPDVELIIEREPYASTGEGAEAYHTQLAAEIMSGKGPDLFWVNQYYMDAFKMMDAGAFADLAPFADADPDFSAENFNMGVVDGCRYKEHLYVMPLNYFTPGFLGKKELLDEVGFDYAGCTDCVSQWEELSRYARRYIADPSLPNPLRSPKMNHEFPNLAGISWLDMENKRVDLSDPRWETVFTGYRLLWDARTEEEKNSDVGRPSNFVEITSGEYLFEGYSLATDYSRLIGDARLIAKTGTPVFYPFYDVNGGVQAMVTEAVGVRRTSPNQQNAYNFIKMLLSPEVQGLTGSFAQFAFPLYNQALKDSLDAAQEEMSGTWYFADPGLSVSDFAALSPKTTQSIWETAQKISGAYLPSDIRNEFFRQMRPYIQSQTDFAAAIKEAEANLKIYVSE